jgi:hypothetical protein
VNSSGLIQWSKIIGDTTNNFGNAVKQTSDGGFIITGSHHYGATTGNLSLVKTNAGGDTIWTKTIKSSGKAIQGYDVIQTQDGGYAVSGILDTWQSTSYVRGELYLVKFNTLGQTQGIKQYNIDPSQSCIMSAYGNSLLQLPDGSCVVGGTYFNCSTFEMLLIRTFDIGPSGIGENGLPHVSIYPNPATDQLRIKTPGIAGITLRNASGRIVLQLDRPGSDEVFIERSGLPTGLYFITITALTGELFNGKIIFK